MVTFRIEFGKQNSDGYMPVYIRITKKQSKKRIKSPYKVHHSQVSNGEISDMGIDLAVSNIVNKYKAMVLRAGAIVATWTIEDYYDYLTGDDRKEYERRENADGRSKFKLDFIQYYFAQVRKMSSEGRDKTSQGYNTALNHIREYMHGKPIDVNDMTRQWAVGLIEHMRKNGVGYSGIERYMAYNNAVLNKAKTEYNDPDNEEVYIKRSPFDSTRDLWYVPSVKRNDRMETNYISFEALQYMLTLEPVKERYTGNANIAWNAWLLSFGLCGMNAKDMYELQTLGKGGKVEYARSKTAERSKNAKMSLVIHPLIQPIHERLRCRFGGKVWCFSEKWKMLDHMYHGCNGGLREWIRYAVECYCKEYGKSESEAIDALGLPEDISGITFYSARHTWANIAANECGISTDVIDRALCHSGKNLAEKSYIKTDFKVIDSANAQVIEKLFANVGKFE